MKRLILITCSFLVVFAGVAAAWESCKQISFVSDHHHGSAPVDGHDHHSQSDRQHSNSKNVAIHCPPVGDYLPTATFTSTPDHRVERLPETLVGEFDSQCAQHGSYPLIHGPPGFAHSRIIRPYLLFSVLRI
jgi:hypothetical protein